MKPIIFYPEGRYQAKLYLSALLMLPLHLFVFVWLGTIFSGILKLLVVPDPRPALLGAVALYLAILLIFPRLYFKRIQYEVSEDDMTVCSGLLNKTTRHIRFQAIVDVRIARDWLDQLLGIGTLQVRVAGSALPAIVMNGVGDVDGLFNFVVEATRRKQDELVESSADQQEILLEVVEELRAIRTGQDDLPLRPGSRTQRLSSGKD